MGRQRRCRICHKRPPWRYKNCPPGVCKRCYHRKIWPDRPAARAETKASAALHQDHDDDTWIDNLADLSHDPDEEPQAEPRLPPWPVRRVTAGMKRCPLPDADRLVVLFSDLLSEDPDPWAETGVDLSGAIQGALDGAMPLFLVVESDGLSPHCGRITVTRGCARLLLWEGGGSVCDETVLASTAAAVLAEARERAYRLLVAYPTQPHVEAEVVELVDAPPDS
jgi:hypothetical protein